MNARRLSLRRINFCFRPLAQVCAFAALPVVAHSAILEPVDAHTDAFDAVYTPYAVIASPDLGQVYVTGLKNNAVNMLQLETDPEKADYGHFKGPLVPFQAAFGTRSALDGATGIAISDDAKFIYALGAEDGSIAAFARNAADGSLILIDIDKDGDAELDGLKFAKDLALTTDGRHLYVPGPDKSALLVFARNADGTLSFAKKYADNPDLNGAHAIAISPDGRDVYVMANKSNALNVYGRNPDTGELLLKDVYRENASGISGISGAASIVCAPDGRHLYVAGTGDSALVVFKRDVVSGGLTYLERYINGERGVDGLAHVSNVKISPDGGKLYVVSPDQKSLTVFRRDIATGALMLLEMKKHAANTVDGLDQPQGLALSADGAFIYTAAPLSDQLGVFGGTMADVSIVNRFVGQGTSDLSPTVAPDTVVQFEITVTNNAVVPVTGAVVTDLFSEKMDYVSAQPDSGICTQVDQAVSCALGTIPAGGRLRVLVNAAAKAKGMAHSTALVHADQSDGNAPNNRDRESVFIAKTLIATTARNTPMTIDIGTDKDSDFSGLTLVSVDNVGTAGGVASFTAGSSFLLYVPRDQFVGSESFNYTVEDASGARATAKVTVYVDTTPPTEKAEVAATSKSGGGGGLAWLTLALLGISAIRRHCPRLY